MHELPKEMLEAFQRIEKKVQNESRAREQAERQAQLSLRERELRRRKLLERITVIVTLCFTVLIALAAWYAKDGGQGAGSGGNLAGNAQGENGESGSNVDCNDPRLKVSRFCLEQKAAKSEANWNGLTRGEDKPFSLHNKGPGGKK